MILITFLEYIFILQYQKRSKGRPKKDGEIKKWDIRLTPTDQVEVDFNSLNLEDFKILLVCKEGTPNGEPRLHYHMYAETPRSDNYIDNLLNQLGKSTETKKGNAVFSKRKAHEGTLGYVVKYGDVKLRHGINDQFLTEIFKRSESYVRNKATERKVASRAQENSLAAIMKDAEVERLTDSLQITKFILDKCNEQGKRFPSRTQVETAVMTILYKTNPDDVLRYYTKFF